jgi:hypothetical protein
MPAADGGLIRNSVSVRRIMKTGESIARVPLVLRIGSADQ